MSALNRHSKEDAKKIIEKLFPEKEARNACLKMFAEAIVEAKRYGNKKWSVTL